MSKKFKHWTLRCSQKIYTRLLAAYPKAHREKYGGPMRQLFADQSCDAWNEARVWGLIKFWLHVLPDWFKTLTFEHFSALRQISPTRAFFISFLLIFFGVTATNFMLPKYYAGETKILFRFVKVEKNKMFVSPPAYDPYVIQAEMEFVCSDAVLSLVVDKFALDEKWSKSLQKPLTIPETIELLRQRIAVKPVGLGSVVQIQVFDKNPEEARNLASAIVGSYLKNHVLKNSLEHPDFLKLSQQKPLNIQIVEMAHITAFPNKPKNLFLGALVGIALGFVAVIAIKINRAISSRLSNQKMAAQN